MELDVVLKLLLFFALLLMSGFFAGSETALFSLGPIHLMKLEEEGHPRAHLVRTLLEQPRRLIATIFIGNELVNIAASALMASTTHSLLGGRPWIVTAVSTVISVALILFIGEITPKNLAVRMVERWSCIAARPLSLLAVLMAPVRWSIEKIADAVVHLLGRKVPSTHGTGAVGEDEFLTMVDAVKDGGDIDEKEQTLIHKVFEFGDRKVTEVMTPANKVLALSFHLSLGRVLAEVRNSIFSRIPVYHENRNRIVGVLYAKDLIQVAFKVGRSTPRLQDLLHPGYFIPKTTKCEQLFREFRRRRTHLAFVVDEYGHFIGLVTMEDLLEELFGEIRDEKELPSPTGEFRVGGGGEPSGEGRGTGGAA